MNGKITLSTTEIVGIPGKRDVSVCVCFNFPFLFDMIGSLDM